MTLSGILGRKIGMTQLYRDDGRLEAATVIEAGPTVVTQVKTPERDGYAAVQVGFGEAKRLTAPERGHLGYGGLNRNRRTGRSAQRSQGSQLGLLRYLREFPAPPEGAAVGDKYDVSIFAPGQLVDISGRSKGKGFAGGVRRYGFHGGPKTHGQSDKHRAPGSVGATTTPGRVVKGLRMAGHLGDRDVTVQHLEVLRIDQERNLLFVRGAVPGSYQGLLVIRPSRRQPKGVSG
jgi:large subunit ribosomal protein L3